MGSRLSPSLAREIRFGVYGSTLRSAPFLSWASPVALRTLAGVCWCLVFNWDDCLFDFGEITCQVYFLLRGMVRARKGPRGWEAVDLEDEDEIFGTSPPPLSVDKEESEEDTVQSSRDSGKTRLVEAPACFGEGCLWQDPDDKAEYRAAYSCWCAKSSECLVLERAEVWKLLHESTPALRRGFEEYREKILKFQEAEPLD